VTLDVLRRAALVESQTAGEPVPSDAWNRDVATRALNEFLGLAGKYRSATSDGELMRFPSRFRWYSPFAAAGRGWMTPRADLKPVPKWGGR
jgi:hypothetical protein